MNLKKILVTLLQAAVTLLLLWWIFHDPSKRAQMVQALSKADPLWLVPGFLCFGLVLVCAAFRWQLLMQVQGIVLPWFRVWQLVMIGMFYNLFLPGGTGGDLVKVFYAVREAPKAKSAVFLSVVVDRITGMVALILVSAGVFLWFRGTLMSLPIVRAFLVTVAIIFGAFLGLILLAVVIDRFHLASRLPEKMPGHAAILEIARAFSVYARDWRVIVAAILISMPLNLFIFGTGIFAAYAFVGNPGAAAMTSVIPIVNTISSLPISVAGIGVREKLFAMMLHPLYGTPEDLAVLISITGFALAVLWSLLGGAVNIFYRPSDGSVVSRASMGGEIGTIEQQIEDEEKAS
jgi:uncharacterized protein (TIRG00374 family)